MVEPLSTIATSCVLVAALMNARAPTERPAKLATPGAASAPMGGLSAGAQTEIRSFLGGAQDFGSTKAELKIVSSQAQPLSAQWDKLHRAVQAYSNLSDDWDGEGSLAPTEASIRAAREFIDSMPSQVQLPRPMLSSRGHTELYWDTSEGYVDVSFGPDGVASWYGKHRASGQDFYVSGLAAKFGAFPEPERLLVLIAPGLDSAFALAA